MGARRHEPVLLAEAWNGGDPMATRETESAAISVKGLGDRFLMEHAEIHCKPSAVREYSRLLREIIVPALRWTYAAETSRHCITGYATLPIRRTGR